MSRSDVTVKGADVTRIFGNLLRLEDMIPFLPPETRKLARSLLSDVLAMVELVRRCSDCGAEPQMESVIGLKAGADPRFRVVCSCGRSSSFTASENYARYRWNTQ